ncbi:uncharacterized SAM-binding protein YcdF (DUF218 family) [Bacilli bacterium PM5-3]|nr:uncharacterized SAM-binding protein YcdF (DUF218 family) [Bacilli bacterium PM5-3]MDH6604334.1 uncharacterized SAM-binding protein YcdF (DUF218 family) [Bacilli bacterium PM5-9]
MKKIVAIAVIVIIILLYLVPFSLIMYHKDSKIEQPVDYLIVLGAKVNDKGPSLMLSYRLDEAIKYYEENNDVMIVVSGGQGEDEEYPEAVVMKNYLYDKGIPTNKIIVEDKSTSTFENLENSKALIDDEKSIGVVTNDFHIYRSSMICYRVFDKKCEMQSAKNFDGLPGIYSLLREPFALYKSYFLDR